MTSALDSLIKSNEYPIIFIGSGIPRRYLEGFPGWEELLGSFWGQIGDDRDFYAFLNQLRLTVEEKHGNIPENEISYYTNIEAGAFIEEKFNAKFYKQEILIDGFTQHEAYRSRLSPFKFAIAKRFSTYTIKDSMKDEYSFFQRFLSKAQMILTTNYDGFIEDSYDEINSNGIKVYVGQKGFFEQTLGWAEIFKIHGSYTDPSSIIISKSDYDKFEKNSVLISAKIISMLIHSPIIFMGYSLTDLNVRKILRDFSSALTPSDIKSMSSRIIVVERSTGEQQLLEQKHFDTELGCEYTVIRTDNYAALCEKLALVNQGVSPSEVRRYQQVIRKLIVDRGRKGSLNTLLIAPEQLEDIEDRIGDENLVVALGDTTYIFRIPDLITYVHDYIFDLNEMSTEIALRFVAAQNPNSRIPFFKYLIDVDLERSGLNSVEKEKIKQRAERYTDLKDCIGNINQTYRLPFDTIEEIRAQGYTTELREQETIAFNVERIKFEELENYLKEKITEAKAVGEGRLTTQMRKLLLAYDYLRHKKEVSA